MDKSDTPELQFETSYTDALESRSRGDFATAAKLFRTALALARSFGEADERVYNSLLGLARCHYRLGNREQAEEHYRHALRIMENQIGDDHPNRFASVLWELAILYTDQSRFKEATLFFKQAILMTSNSAGPQDRFVADCLWGMSKCLCALGQLPDAERAIREAIAIYEATGDDVSEFVLTNQNNLVSVLIEQLKFSQAIAEVEKAIAILSRPDPSQPANKTAEIANNLCQLAWCQQRLNDFEKAGRTLKKALKITRAHDGPGSIRTALTKVALAHNYHCLNQHDKAEKLLLQAIEILEKEKIADLIPDLGGAMFELSLCYLKQDKKKEAIILLKELLILHEEDPLANPELFADTLFQLGQCHEQALNYRKARDYYQRSVDIREKLYGLLNEEVASSMMHLARCLLRIDEISEATMLQQQADQIISALKSRA